MYHSILLREVRRGAVLLLAVLLLFVLFVPGMGIHAQNRTQPKTTSSLSSLYSPSYPILPDTTADWWIEHHISVSSRHYIGVEVGMTHAWTTGAHNFFFPFQSDNGINSVQTQLPFGALGFGEGSEIGGVIDFSLSDHIGLQGKLRYFNNATSSSSSSRQFVTDPSGASSLMDVTSNYSMVQNYIGADALMRYQLVPQTYYALGGFGVAVPITQAFNTTVLMQPITGAQAGSAPTSATMNAPINSNYFNTYRIDARIGIGTFIPITEDMVITPEIMLTIPTTPLFTRGYESSYRSAGVSTPRLWYLTASISVKFPNGGFSLYATERERERQYQEQLRVAQLQHPLPMLKHFDFHPASITLKQPSFPPDTLPDYEVDNEGRLIRWEDLGPRAEPKLRLVAFFQSGKTELSDISYPDLDHLARVMLKHQYLEVEIAAYTDIVGSYKKNVLLSQERAEVVKLYLIHEGINGDRLPAHGYGPEHPVATNSTPGGRASNRRVEFVVINPRSAMLEQGNSVETE